MKSNDKSTEKRNDNATKTIEEPIAEVTDQHADAVAGGLVNNENIPYFALTS